MLKNWKILVLWGALVWIVMFVVVSILMYGPGIKSISWPQWIIEWIVSAALGFFIVKQLVKSYGGQLKEGLIYGAILMAITFILDLGITVPTFMGGKFVEFLSNWVMWVGVFLFLVASAIVGQLNIKGAGPQVPQQPPAQPASPDFGQQQ